MMMTMSNETSDGKCDSLLQKKQRASLTFLGHVPAKDLTLRQLRDTVQNLQQQWVGLCIPETMQPGIVTAVDALFHR